MNPSKSVFWKSVYTVYPPVLRILERIRIHHERQPFSRGRLNPEYSAKELCEHLKMLGFENAILAWKDPGEVLSLRKIDKEIFQYHIRLFSDGELCCHYEYSSEGNPLGHVTEKCFEPRVNEFTDFLGKYLVPLSVPHQIFSKENDLRSVSDSL